MVFRAGLKHIFATQSPGPSADWPYLFELAVSKKSQITIVFGAGFKLIVDVGGAPTTEDVDMKEGGPPEWPYSSEGDSESSDSESDSEEDVEVDAGVEEVEERSGTGHRAVR